MKTVKYAIAYNTIEVTDAEYALVKALYTLEANSRNKIELIKFVRGQYNLDLRSAKDLCDNIFNGV
jgi:ribosomal protein L7/L12